MTPDKKWMDLSNDRLGQEYGQGTENFLDYAFERTGATNEIRCPCVKCANVRFGSRESVKMHLIVYGILQNYRFWYHHGEKPEDELEKLPISFYMDQAVGLNHQAFTRHLGIIVRDGNICPIRILAWNKIDEDAKNHMWAAVTDKFKNDDIELYREVTLKHMQQLWKNWRCEMNSKFVKPCKTRQEVLQNVPKGMDKQDWEWLATEYYLSESFQKMSKTNAQNRSVRSMPHRTGSKPFRQLTYEMGGKDGQPPDIASIFFETRKKDDHIIDLDAMEKCDEICEVVREDSSLSNIEIVEKCFKHQRHNYIFGYGGGVRPKDVRGHVASKRELHQENVTLREKINNMEFEFKAFKELMLKNLPPNVQINTSASDTIEGIRDISED